MSEYKQTYSICCLNSLMNPISFKDKYIIYICVKCGKKYHFLKRELSSETNEEKNK